MDDEREEFLNDLMDAIAESRSKMTPIERMVCDIRCDEIMQESSNHFWIRYRSQEPGRLLIDKERLQELGREEEIKILWLLENAPFSFRGYGAA